MLSRTGNAIVGIFLTGYPPAPLQGRGARQADPESVRLAARLESAAK
jgi:hypothetical protein